MEENEEKNEKKPIAKITLKSLLSIILIIVLIGAIVMGAIYYYDYLKNNDNDYEVYDDNYDDSYSDYTNDVNMFENVMNDNYYQNEVYDGDYVGDVGYDPNQMIETSLINAINYICTLNNNPFYEMASSLSGYEISKKSTLQSDGSYNIKLSFSELCDIMYSNSLYPSCLKTNQIIKSSINILSENEINVKDTGIQKDYDTSVLSLENIESNQYKAKVCLREILDGYENSVKYLEVTATLDSNYLITEINWTEISKEDISSELLDEIDSQENYFDYNYSDYLSN